MTRVISGHTKTELRFIMKLLLNVNLECSFHMLSAWVKHQMVVDINNQAPLYTKNSTVSTEFPMRSKLNFSQWKTYFPQLYIW